MSGIFLAIIGTLALEQRRTENERQKLDGDRIRQEGAAGGAAKATAKPTEATAGSDISGIIRKEDRADGGLGVSDKAPPVTIEAVDASTKLVESDD